MKKTIDILFTKALALKQRQIFRQGRTSLIIWLCHVRSNVSHGACPLHDQDLITFLRAGTAFGSSRGG